MQALEPGCGALLVVDDDPGVRAALSAVLATSGYRALEAATGEDALVLALATPPLLALLDVNLPGISGYEVCRALRERHGQRLPIVFLSGERTEPFDRVAGLLVGADDYVVKPFAPDELLARIRRLLRQEDSTRASVLQMLSPRELEVLELLAEGLDQGAIARRLVISPKTVATHIARILGKLGVRSRAQAVAVAYRDRLLESGAAIP